MGPFLYMGKANTSLLLHRSVVLSTSLKTLYKNPKKKKKTKKKGPAPEEAERERWSSSIWHYKYA